MSIANDCTIEIAAVANGFIVRRQPGSWFGHERETQVWTGDRGDYLVFRTLAELQHWLAEHFTHRARPNWPDVMPLTKTEADAKAKAK